MEIFMGIIIVFLILVIINSKRENNFIQSQVNDIKLVEYLQYEKYLQKNFRFVKPKYAGWYMGEAIAKGDKRLPHLIIQNEFLADNGEWVVKKGKKL